MYKGKNLYRYRYQRLIHKKTNLLQVSFFFFMFISVKELVGVPNPQLITHFSTKYQLPIIFYLANYQLFTNLG